jgi:hypothetical protein
MSQIKREKREKMASTHVCLDVQVLKIIRVFPDVHADDGDEG